MRIALDDTPFEGRTRSFSYLAGTIHYPKCPRCSSSLAGRHEITSTRTIATARAIGHGKPCMGRANAK